jgi:hypothetical protein
MVPTELLAIQHYHHLLNLLENMEEVEHKPSVALLTGSTPSKQSRIIREACIIFYLFCIFYFILFVFWRFPSLRLGVGRVSKLEISHWSLGPTV